MMEKVYKEKLQGVETRLTYSGSSHRDSQTREETQLSKLESCDRSRRPKKRRKPSPIIASKGERKKNVHSRLGPEVTPRRRHASERSASSSRSAEDLGHRKKDARNLIRSYVTCFSERQREIEEEWDAADLASGRQPVRTEEPHFF
ncbi:hypothetical protein Tco_0597479 [Tanacetum coccineum]